MKRTKSIKQYLKKIWYFLWEDDSLISWVASVVFAFLLIKFIIFPGLGLILGTKFPIVAVVSGSMEHSIDDGGILCGKRPENYTKTFDNWWEVCGGFYEGRGISKEEFRLYPLSDGFNTGDIITLRGIKFTDIKIGDVIVFTNSCRNEPIIHRVVEKDDTITTKGDHNAQIGKNGVGGCDEDIAEDEIYGKALFRIPYLGYLKKIVIDVASSYS